MASALTGNTENANSSVPEPPPHLAEYVGDRNRPDPVASYLGAGRALR